MGLRDTRGAGKRAARPPSPLLMRRARPASPAPVPVTLKDPQRIGTGSAGDLDVKDAIRAVIEQQRLDHDYLVEAAAAVRALGTALAEEQSKRAAGLEEAGQLHLGLRRELYAVRDTLEGSVQQKVPEMLNNMFEPNGPGFIMVAKLEETQRAVAALQLHVASLTNQEEQVENFLKNLQQELPRDGQALANYVNTEVGQVREMVKKFEPGNVTTCSSQHIPFTHEMSRHIRALEETINQHQQGFNEMVYAFNAIQAEQGVTTQRIAANDLDIKGIKEEIATGQDASFRAGLCGSGPCGGGCGPGVSGVRSPGAPGMGAFGSMNGLNAGPAGGQQPGSSGDGNPLGVMAAVIGGNGRCHCIHVKEVIEKVAALERAGARGGPGFAPGAIPRAHDERAPFLPSMRPHVDGGDDPEFDILAPLTLRPLGLLASDKQDRAIFDEKMAATEFRFDGVKGGAVWKSRIERYFISKVPALREILLWAEKHDQRVVTEENFLAVVIHGIDEWKQQVINAQIWGFLSSCVHGTAETMFKQAEMLNGLDSWRRIVRVIDNGLPLQLEQLRGEVRMLHTRPIKDLESVATGIAEFDAKLKEYSDAGGTGFDKDNEKKSDLLAILPARLREDLLWNASGKETYIAFRDMVLVQSARILFDRNRSKPGVHAVDEYRAHDGDNNDEHHDDETVGNMDSLEDVIAFIKKFGNPRRQDRSRQERQRQSTERDDRRPRQDAGRDDRPPRKCPNCDKTHPERRCPEPPVALSDRKCWQCNKKGHNSSACPEKKRPAIKAIEDAPAPFFGYLNMVSDANEFQPVRNGVRPQPRGATLADFLDHNSFNVLREDMVSVRGSTGTARGSSPDIKAPVPRRPLIGNGNDEERTNRVKVPPPPTPTATRRPAPSRPSATTPISKIATTSPSSPTPSLTTRGGLRLASSSTCLATGHAASMKSDASHGVPGGMALPADEASPAETPRSCQANCLCQAFPLPSTATRANPRGRRPQKKIQDHAKQQNEIIDEALMNISKAIQAEESIEDTQAALMLEEEEHGMIGAATEEVRVKTALDSGSVANVISPDDLPASVEIEENKIDSHFSGAGGERIRRWGACNTQLKGKCGEVGCRWQVADVTKALHSVSTVCGPIDHPTGLQDVLFNNRTGYVVPPGVVDEIMKKINPVAEYGREGGLYVADMVVSTFRRQGQDA